MRPPPVRLRLLLTPPERDDLPESALEAARIPGSFGRGGGPPVAVVDVLRATTTLTYAFAAGAREALFFATPEAARAARPGDGRSLLCGEREGRRIPGFDLGNSPLEYLREKVEDRSLLFASTNGSRAFLSTHDASVQWAVSFVNLEAAVQVAQTWLEGHRARAAGPAAAGDPDAPEAPDLLVVCAGKLGEPASEDTACAARFVLRLIARMAGAGADVEVQAEGSALGLAPENEAETRRIVHESEHGRYLASLGGEFEADVDAAARWDRLAIVPGGRAARLAG